MLDLVLFATDPGLVARALEAEIRAMIVDFEWRGKEERQKAADTEINRDRPEDLETLRAAGVPRRYCRLNRLGPWTAGEVRAALAAGATHLFLPMVETPAEIEDVLRHIDGRCPLGILVETAAGVARARDLAAMPVDLVYVGLNDLAISRGTASIFDAVADGTVEGLRGIFADQAFGFAGVTVVDGGKPIPFRLLLAEMARLECSFSFLRRSFKRDVRGRDLAEEVDRIRRLWDELLRRQTCERARDRAALWTAIKAGGPVRG